MNNSAKTVNKICKALDEKLADTVKIIDISKISVIADYFIIAGGFNGPHMEALVDNVSEKLNKEEINPIRTEGAHSNDWVLMDYGDVVLHVFSKEARSFYDLEHVWSDGTIYNVDEFSKIEE